VLHPYFKLAYIKLAWGGAEEQAAEPQKGNRLAKNWQDEAQKILEITVSCAVPSVSLPNLFYASRWKNTGRPILLLLPLCQLHPLVV